MIPWRSSNRPSNRDPRLICTVSTVKDTTANVTRFVERNLAAGVDHMFVFLEGPSDQFKETVHALEDYQEHVTPMRVGPRYWNHDRPGLNQRQVTNAGFVNCLLAPFPEVQWLFHIDGDECLDIDRERLLDLPPDVPCVRLRTREAVSRAHWDGEVSSFKRQLDHEDLCLLTVLGVISGPSNVRYFNGHLGGKLGLRPNPDLRLLIHQVVDSTYTEIEPFEDDFLHLLHYESHSGEEFVRKWLAHLSNGKVPVFSARKDQLRAAIVAVLRNPALTEDQKNELLMELYRSRIEDDFSTLDRLGLLVTPEAALHNHSPNAFAPQDAQAIRRLKELLRRSDKSCFIVNRAEGGDGRGPHAVELLRDARTRLDNDTHLAKRIDRFLGSPSPDIHIAATTPPGAPDAGH